MLNNIQYEERLYNRGIKLIAGVDEVGRGPLAGPLVVCAAILRINDVLAGRFLYLNKVRDSKILTDKIRRELEINLKKDALDFCIFEIDSKEVDRLGIAGATKIGFLSSVRGLKIRPEHVLTDMFAIKEIPHNKQTNIIKGDSLSISIGAASILAKVHRDNIMIKMHTKYPQYGFDEHKGYGTEKHLKALAEFGPCDIHRVSFEPLRSAVANN